MKNSNNTQTRNSKILGLALAAFLIPAGAASAHDHVVVKKNVSGHVEVAHQIPGGTVTVGAEWGKSRPAPQVVVVKESPQVIVVEKRGHGHKHYSHRDREVTIVREAPRRQVTIVKTVPAHREVTVVKSVPAGKKVVVIEKRGGDRYDNRHDDRHDDRGWDRDDNRRGDRDGRFDDRDGQKRIVYVRK